MFQLEENSNKNSNINSSNNSDTNRQTETNNNNNDNDNNVIENKNSNMNAFRSSKNMLFKMNRYFKIRNNNLALAIMCMCALMQNILVGGANNAILTTIERAYYMTSIESALFLAFYDIANIISSPFIGYFGDRIHKPYIISLSMFGLAIGSTVLCLPQFISIDSTYDYYHNSNTNINNNNSSQFGDNSKSTSKDYLLCKNIQSSPSSLNLSNKESPIESFKQDNIVNNMKYVFYLANIINGISSVGLYTTAISYIENIFDKEKVHMRQGVYYAIGAIGVGIGMLVTGNFLNVNSSKLKQMIKKDNDLNLNESSSSIDSNSVNWIGAWWAIYLIGAFVNFGLAILVWRFSPRLVLISKRKKSTPTLATSTTAFSSVNNSDDTDTLNSSQTHMIRNNENKKKKTTLKIHLNEFYTNAKSILSNKVYLFIVICTTCETLLIKGFSSYLTKMLEYEYRLPASTATMIAGGIGFISLVGGALLGSFLVKHFKWHIKQCSKFITCILFLTSVLFLGLIIHCPQEKYINSNNDIFQESKCECDSNSFYPICYENEYLFQTPCHAGCRKQLAHKEYSNCTVLNSLLLDDSNRTIKTCQRPAKQCITNLILVSLIGLTVLFLSSIVILPLLRIILESVSIENQSFALGIRSLVTKLFGNIPGPLIFAAIVDRSCVQWTLSNTHNSNKTCRLYDNAKFSLGLGLLGSGFRFLSAIFALITLIFIRKQDSHDLSHDHNDNNNNQGSSSFNNENGHLNRAYLNEEEKKSTHQN